MYCQKGLPSLTYLQFRKNKSLKHAEDDRDLYSLGFNSYLHFQLQLIQEVNRKDKIFTLNPPTIQKSHFYKQNPPGET